MEVEKLFRDVLPPDRVSDDEETRLLSASDIAFEAGCLPACVLRPRAEDEVAAVVRAARAEGVALHPRGGGWSYTAAYAPQSECSAVVDMKNVGGLAMVLSIGHPQQRMVALSLNATPIRMTMAKRHSYGNSPICVLAN